MIDKRFGKLTVVQFSHKNSNSQNVWKCRCDCGNFTYVTSSNLNNGSTQSCGCGRKKDKPKEDLTGQKFNHLTVVRLTGDKSEDGRFLWECKCDCESDEIVIATAKDLKCNRKRSCSCLYNKKQKLPVDLTGKKFGLLRVVKLRRDLQKDNGQFVWECLCECGETTNVLTGNLQSGQSKSCGCLKKNPDSQYKVDEIFKAILRVWKGMKNRCNNPNYEHYHNYGGRGIVVCDEWKSLRAFYEWAINNGYERGLQIDRKDVNGNYEPSNCRWVTPKVNSQNKTNNKPLTINGKTKLISQWAEEIGVTIKTLNDRVSRGWSDEELLLGKRQRSNPRKYSGKKLTIHGVEKSYSEWSDIIGISQATLADRVNADWKEDELLMPKGYRRK